MEEKLLIILIIGAFITMICCIFKPVSPFVSYNRAVYKCNNNEICLDRVNNFYKDMITELSKPME